MSLVLLVAAVGGLALVFLAASRPAVACALLAAAIPLTAGLGRGTVLPVLRVNEALLLLVAGGVLLGRLPRRRAVQFNGLDLVVLAFCAGGVLIPWAVILLTHATADLQDWMTILSPVQYLVVYLLFSRIEFSAAHFRLLLNLVMLVSIPVGLIAVAQLLDLGGIRTLTGAYYPVQPMPSWDTVYRPASLLGFYSAVGAFGLLNFLLALALAATRHPGFSPLWLTIVMAVNVVGMLATQTYAPLIALPIGAAAVLLAAGRVPWQQLAVAPPGLVVSAILLWPIIGNRVQQQLAGGGGSVLKLPESIAVRVDYWQGFFLPALLKHGLWLGTGTLIPSEVPRPLIAFVDNGYLWQAFRGGLPGLALYLLLLGAILTTAWKTRFAESRSRQALAAVCVGVVVSVVLLDTTSEYLVMTAVSQEFWMLAGLLTGLAFAARPSPASVVELASPSTGWRGAALGWGGQPVGWRAPSGGRRIPPVRRRVPPVRRSLPPARQAPPARPASPAARALPQASRRVAAVGQLLPPLGRRVLSPRERMLPAALGWWTRALAFARRLAPGRVLVRSSLAVLVGYSVARLLGFAFQVVSGHLLAPADYGSLNYALAVAAVASILLSTAPVGLSRFLARHADSPPEQERYYTNWLAAVVLILGVSVLVTVIVAPAIGLGGWMLVGLLANLLGTGALVTYLEVQRGLGRYTLQSAFWVLANVLQLSAVLTLGALHLASPAFLLTVYGLSGVAALLCFLPLSRHGPRLAASALGWSHVKGVLRFLRPVLVQSVFWNLWFSGDMILVQHLAGATATGIYGAAKAISNGFAIIPSAVAFVFVPQVARLAETQIRGHLVRALAFTTAMMLPAAAIVMFVAAPLTVAVFGDRYRESAVPLTVLVIGQSLFGLKSLLGGLWLGIGRPIVETVSTAAGMVTTLAAGLLLIPDHGAVGAALAFGAGAAAQLLVDGGVTLWAFGGRTPRVMHLGDEPAAGRGTMETDEPAATRGTMETMVEAEPEHRPGAPQPAPLLFLAEDVGPLPDEGYTRFIGELATALSVRRPLIRPFTAAGAGPRRQPLRSLRRAVGLLRAVRSKELTGRRPVVVYASRRSVTGPALLRARAVKLLSGRAPVVMIALRGCSVGSGRLLRRLAPDLLLLPTSDECEAVCRHGVNAAYVWSGVDLERFRAPMSRGRATRRPHRRDSAWPAVEADAWPAIGDRLLCLLDDLVLLGASPPSLPAGLRALAAKARRSYVARRGWWRRFRWGDQVAYETREPRGVAVTAVAAAGAPPALATPGSEVVGLMGTSPDLALAAAAELAGLRLETAARRGPDELVDRALKERWALLHLRSEHLDALPDARWSMVAAYMHAGGTLYVDGLKPAQQERLAAVCGLLRVTAPNITGTPLMGWLSFPAERADFARELAGTRLECPGGRTALSAPDGWEVLVHGGTPDKAPPVMVRHALGKGALVLNAGPSELEGHLAAALAAGSGVAIAAVLPIMLLRAVYGSVAWHAPAALANFTIDDPALRRGLLGPRWDLLLGRARDHDFHVTIATVPRELALADAAVVELLRRHPDRLSACYHGCDHGGYEFYAPDAPRTRYRPRPLAGQRRALDRAVDHGRRFTRAHGLELDRVMVFPYGVGPAEIFGDLHRLGFVGTCNYWDKYPPGSPPPDDPDLGLRPADLAWAGFPLLWRRGIRDQGYLIDLLLGRPLLTFGHTYTLGADLAPFVERADRINQATRGSAVWCDLDEVARHAYLQRHRPDGRWQVLMTTNEACLHNPGPEPRTVLVERPQRPPDTVFEVDGKRGHDLTRVVVPPGGVTVVRLVAAADEPALAGRRSCSLFPSTQEELR